MQKRILIVDDEKMIRDLLNITLSRAGYETQAVADGSEALKALRRESFDLAITDVVMPGVSGLELLKLIRRDHPATRVLILTGQPTLSVWPLRRSTPSSAARIG